MRFIIETNTEDAKKNLVEFVDNSEGIEPITGYDPIEKLTSQVEKMYQAFSEFKSHRGSWRILNYYLRGRDIAQNEIDRVLEGVEEFMSQVKE